MSAFTASDADVAPDPPVDAASVITVGGAIVTADTAAGLIIGGAIDLHALDAGERDTVLQLVEIGRRRADAALNLVAESGRRSRSFKSDGHTSMRAWGKALCNWSNHQATVTNAVLDLITAHHLCRREYLAGRLGLAQLTELSQLARHPRAGTHFPDSEALLVEDAQKLSHEDFKVVCRRWLTLTDPDGADQDEAIKHHLRNGCVVRDSDGMVHLDAQFAGAQGATIKGIFERFYDAETQADFDAVRAERRAAGNDDPVTKNALPRTDEQRRADVLYAVFINAASAAPDAKPPEPVVNIVVDLDTFEHLLNDEPVDPATYRTRKCETADGGPVAPSDVVAAAMTGYVRRIVVDGPSTIIDKGRRQRLFTGSAREAAKLQHPRCTYPGCGVPTTFCQIDHVKPSREDGPTAPWNAQPRCPLHNRWKELGYHTWQDAGGHWHTRRPDGTEIRHV